MFIWGNTKRIKNLGKVNTYGTMDVFLMGTFLTILSNYLLNIDMVRAALNTLTVEKCVDIGRQVS